MKNLLIKEFMALSPADQDGALMIYYPYKEGTDGPAHALFVSTREDQNGGLECENCGSSNAFIIYADGDEHNPFFCRTCYKELNETAEFYTGTDKELMAKFDEIEGA